MANIMLVDDSMFLKMTLSNIITTYGHKVIGCANNGSEAVEKYRQLNPDLVFMDITMPNMSGIEAVKEIMKIDSDARVVMCTAMGQSTMVRDAVIAGAKDFIVKPFSKEKIKEVIEKHAKK